MLQKLSTNILKYIYAYTNIPAFIMDAENSYGHFNEDIHGRDTIKRQLNLYNL